MSWRGGGGYNKRGPPSHHGGGGRYGGGGGYSGGGYSGGGGGGGYGRQPQQRFNDAPSNTEIQVLTNQNKLLALDKPNGSANFIQYKVTFRNAWYRRVIDEATGEKTDALEWNTAEEIISDENMEKFSKRPFPWRIIKKLVGDQKFVIAYDGGVKAYSPSANSGPKEKEKYRVEVKRDCEEDDSDADKLRKTKWYELEFSVKKTIPFADVVAVLRGGSLSEEITTMLNIILTSNAILTAGMISLATNSSEVFFPLNKQQFLIGRKAPLETRDNTKILLSGLKMTVLTQKGGVVMTESVVKYANKEFTEVPREGQRHREGASRVPLLNVDRGCSIAGVRIESSPYDVVDQHDLRAIEEALLKLGNINMMYNFISKKTGREVCRLYKNKPFWRDERDDSMGKGLRIMPSAHDYKFTAQDRGEFTVASWFENEYGIRLRYPNMPIIHINDVSKKGAGVWLPVEFGFQAWGKSKENGEEIVTNILKYHDAVSGKRYIEEVENKLEELKITGRDDARFNDRMNDWQLQIETRAVEETAKIIKKPPIKFAGMPSNVNNGSFNLNRVKFSRPARLASFAVVNFTHNKHSCYDFVKKVTEVAKGHGMEIPSAIMEMVRQRDSHYLDLVTVHHNGKDAVADALDVVSEAIQKAKYFHLYDSEGIYRNNHCFYNTYCFSDEQAEFECLVLPPDNKKERLGLLLDYKVMAKDNHYFSHRIITQDGSEHDVRLMVKIKETDSLIDPLDFRYHDGCHQACRSNGDWRNVGFLEHCYICPKTETVFSEREVYSKSFKHFTDDWEVDFPSIVFAYKPTDDKPLYDRIKVVSNYFGGVQSQCAVMKKYEAQGSRKDQYASNIATKMNAKLSTIYDKAISWTSTHDGGRGDGDMLPWVGDAPTMVLGLGMAHGMGKAAKSVIVASLCLDSGGMRLSHSCYLQKKAEKTADAISKCIMKDIIRGAIDCYANENGHKPERLLFHRDGLSDGNFKQADVEIECIKEAVEEKLGHSIPVTFVICQSQQLGFRMAPSVDIKNYRGKLQANVPSGTELDCGSNSFYIVAQGGLKGTSKPVKHIVHLNENEMLTNQGTGLTLKNLKDCTFHMCHKYPTATKAVREVPTIKYAKRLANQVLSSLSCLEEGYRWFGKKMRLVCPEDDTLSEEEMRPYLEILNGQDEPIFPEHRQYNIVEMPFRSHLAA